MNKKNLLLTTIIITLLAMSVSATMTPFQQCVQLLNGLGQPIITGTCYMTDNATIYNNTLMNNNFDGTYCLTINNSFPQGTYSFTATCYYLNTSGTGAGTFTIDNCTENWVLQSPNCEITNNYTKTYYDYNDCGTTADLPIDNNTIGSCNYCDESIFQNTSECESNGTQTVSYFDNNYASCCAVTGLLEDCSILYPPYNTITTQNCIPLLTQINCTLDPQPILNPKINVNCVMPDNEEYCCVVNTYQGTNLLATSPEYKNPSSSILTLGIESETRNCFPTTNKLLNAYYTTKELRPKIGYTIEVLCTSNSSTLRTQSNIMPVYHTEDWLTARINWFGDNPMTLIGTGLLILAVIFLLILIIKKLRGR